jgi:uncharacterized protein (TIGR03435 family)
MTLVPFANHLWQSTLVVGVVALLALVVRRNGAQVRYWAWMAASVKFLIPFAAISAIGRGLGSHLRTTTVAPEVPFIINAISEPFSPRHIAVSIATTQSPLSAFLGAVPAALIAVSLIGTGAILLAWWRRWHRVATIVRTAPFIETGRELDALRRVEQAADIRRPLPLRITDAPLEPGAFGILRPVLVWPRSLSERLSDTQIDAILAHELAHVQRHDNVTALVHMAVQAAFWFHPLVWWIGSRLIDERERACDEYVTECGTDRQLYAESILKVCEFHVESPLACVAGVTGSDLKKRIEAIMTNVAVLRLTWGRRMVLAATALAALVGPLINGSLSVAPLKAQSLAVASSVPPFTFVSIKAGTDGSRNYPLASNVPPGRFTARNTTLQNLLASMYNSDGRLSGGPDWIRSERFDIDAIADGTPTDAQMRLMVRRLLADYFKLVVHKETRPLPIYALVLVRSDRSLGLRPSSDECVAAAQAMRSGQRPRPPAVVGRDRPPEPNELPCGFIAARPQGTVTGRATTMADIARGGFEPIMGRKVVDQTGLSGYFDLDLEYMPAVPPGPPPTPLPPPVPPEQGGRPAPSIGPAFFTAVQEQLGLNLISETGPVDLVVIDNVERPTLQ